MRIELEPHEIKALGGIMAEHVLQSLAPKLDILERAFARMDISLLHPQPLSLPAVTSGSSESVMLNRRDLLTLLGVGNTTLWRLRQSGDFPAEVKLSSGRIAWVRSEVMAWIESRRTV